MIRNESEFHETEKRIALARASFDRYRQKMATDGFTPQEIERALGPSRLTLHQLEAELAQFERLKQGDLTSFSALEHLGQLLVGARIALGLSQRELANRLDIDESQVSRNERKDYSGVSWGRAVQIFDKLDVDVVLSARPRHGHQPVYRWYLKPQSLSYQVGTTIIPTLPEPLIGVSNLGVLPLPSAA